MAIIDETTALVGNVIELRSDTFTLPTPEMLAAIVKAPLGNDGYGEDPTVIKLERLSAERLGKQAACLTPSGTMANLACILAHCQDGNFALVGDRSDIFAYEDQGLARCCGVHYVSLETQPNGTLLLSDIEQEFERCTSVKLVCLETPHNLNGGLPLGCNYIRQVAALAHARGAYLHLDAARLFNAVVALGVDAAEICRETDSVQFCLSKGLAAPVGSVVAGSHEFIQKVRARRQMLGGDMRQAGIIAAAGIVALDKMVDRLRDDHEHARIFAEGLASVPGIEVDPGLVQTNTVVFRIAAPQFNSHSFIQAARGRGVHLSNFKYGRLRAVMHWGIGPNDIRKALQIIVDILKEESGVTPE